MVRCRSFIARLCGVLALAAGACAFAQAPAQVQPAPRAAAPAAASSAARAPVVPLDRVIAVVNDEAVTQYDLGEQRRIILQQM
jgi:hypothetical protein